MYGRTIDYRCWKRCVNSRYIECLSILRTQGADWWRSGILLKASFSAQFSFFIYYWALDYFIYYFLNIFHIFYSSACFLNIFSGSRCQAKPSSSQNNACSQPAFQLSNTVAFWESEKILFILYIRACIYRHGMLWYFSYIILYGERQAGIFWVIFYYVLLFLR